MCVCCCSCINWYFFPAAVCCAGRKTGTICYFPPPLLHSVCRVSRANMCKAPPFAKIQTGESGLGNTPGDKTDSFSGSGLVFPCQSQIGHFANWQLTNWAADSDPFEIEGVLGESWWSREGGGGLHRGVSQTESLHNHRLWGSFLGKCVHHRHRQTQGGFYSEAHLNIRGFLEVKFCHFASLLICLWVAVELPPALLQTRVTNVLTRVTG